MVIKAPIMLWGIKYKIGYYPLPLLLKYLIDAKNLEFFQLNKHKKVYLVLGNRNDLTFNMRIKLYN